MAQQASIEIEDTGLGEAFQAALNGTGGYKDEQPVAEPTPEPVVTPPAEPSPAAEPVAAAPTFDFATISGGKVKDENEFKSVLQKAEERDQLESKLKETEGKVINFTNEESKRLYELIASGNEEEAAKYLSEKRRDYATMSDSDVVRASLQKQHPDWTAKDVELELRAEYGKQLELIDLIKIDKEEEPQEYKEAEQHNERVEENLLRLQRAARDARLTLIEQQKQIKLPEIQKAPEATTPTAPTAEELAAQQEKWQKSVDEVLPKLGSIKQTIDDKEVEYSFSDEETKEFGDYMKTFNLLNFAKERGWYNEDGSTNVLKLAEDVRKFNNMDKINKAFATQTKTETTKKVIAEIKNIDPIKRGTGDDMPQSLEEAYWQARDKKSA